MGAEPVFDTLNKVNYLYLRAAAKAFNMHEETLRNMLKGRNPNLTYLVYTKNYEGIVHEPDVSKPHARCKKVIDKITKEIWNTITEAAKANGMHPTTLGGYLNGTSPNKTALTLLKNYEQTKIITRKNTRHSLVVTPTLS